MKILITGAQGMLGTALQDVFRNYELVVLDQTQLDITRSSAVAEKIAEISPQLILNAAAYTNVDGAESNRTAAFAVNEYGASKLAGEQALAQSGARYYLLRTAWLYGPRGKNFVDTMLQLSETKSTLAVVNDQHGSPTFTYDVARATATIISQYEPGIYHAVNQGSTTWHAFAQRIFKQVGREVVVTAVP